MSTDPTSLAQNSVRTLANLLTADRPAIVLTGAGISTDSGIPAYRDDTGTWVQPKPVQAQDFRKSSQVRQRYWLRSMLGWPKFHQAIPNRSHHALRKLEQAGLVSCIITQNVDSLHQKSGSNHVIDLHGALAKVTCLTCGTLTLRQDLQEQLRQVNSDFLDTASVTGPDGDARPVASADTPSLAHFKVIDCQACGGLLKPDVVFYGENVPSERVSNCMQQLQAAGMLLCIGTSLTVMSGFRFCRKASQTDKPIAIINQGKTRADDLAHCRVPLACEGVLQRLCNELL